MPKANPKKKIVVAAIVKHLATVGPTAWDQCRAQHRDIPESTFWRWVTEVRKGDHVTPTQRKVLAAGKARAQDIVARVEGLTGRAKQAAAAAGEDFPDDEDVPPVAVIAQQLPATPSPAIIAQSGGAVVENNIDFMGRLNQLYSDAEKIREWAQHPDGRIKNPQYFMASIGQRRSLLETALHAMETVYDLRKMQEFYDVILAEVGKADPETQRRIMERLEALNSQAGITIHAKL